MRNLETRVRTLEEQQPSEICYVAMQEGQRIMWDGRTFETRSEFSAAAQEANLDRPVVIIENHFLRNSPAELMVASPGTEDVRSEAVLDRQFTFQ